MRIVGAEICAISIPFRFTFRHALASRNMGESILLRLEDERGNVGYGECAPRDYVTGETGDSVFELLSGDLIPPLIDRAFGSFDEVVSRLWSALDGLPRTAHAAFCALELALLDLAGRAFNRSAGEVVGAVLAQRVTYSGVVSADGTEAALKVCEVLRQFGIDSVKLKVGTVPEEDRATLEGARRILGAACSLRIDANGAWTAEQALDALQSFRPFRLDGVEQPVAWDDLEGLAWLTARSPTPVIVDESLVSAEDAETLARNRACHQFNIRISKCGGLLNAVRIHEIGRRAGIPSMLGAQVGETAILSAAGRHFAARSAGLTFFEGSYGTLLLEEDIGKQDLTIGPGGGADALAGFGLGIEVDEARLRPFVTKRSVCTV